MKRKNYIFLARGGLGALTAALCTGAWAQDLPASANTTSTPAPASATPADAGAAETGIADIVVTAERRAASVQRTPLAITAIGGESLQRSQAVNIETIAGKVPNVTFGRNGGTSKVFIRGVGLDALTPGADARVAIYSDGIYNARPQVAFTSFYDLERVEVLAGPQGTLYGRNATAGAINILSRDPGTELNGYGTITVGNYSLIRTEGAIGGPLSDTVSARIAFQTADRSGYGKHIQTGEDVDDEHSRAVRAKLKFEPSSNFNVLLAADYFNSDDHSGGFHYLRNSPGHESTSVLLGFKRPDDPRDFAGQGPNQRLESYGFSSTATLDLGAAKLVSLTGYRHFKQDLNNTSDETTSGYLPSPIREKAKQFSQELRLTGTVGPVDFLVGGYYFHENNFAAIDPAIAGVLIGIPTTALLKGPLYGGTQKTDAYAAFSQATIHVTDKFGIDLGLRYSHEKRKVFEFNELNFGAVVDPSEPLFVPDPALAVFLSQKLTSSKVNPKVTLHYQFTNAIYGYMTYSQGFKTGGFNAGFLQEPFKPEELTNYEAGIKADLFDRRLRINLAGFYYDYKNLQVNVTEGIRLVTRNAASAELYGLEGQITALPVDDLRISLSLSWLHSQYKNYKTPDPSFKGGPTPCFGNASANDPANPDLCNLAGNQLAYAPEYKVDAEIGYTIHSSAGDFTPRANVTWVDRTWFSQFNHPWVSQPSYAELNLYLDYEMPGTGWSASAFMRNATNKYHEVAGTVSSDFIGYQVVGQIAPPRTFGLAVTKRF